MSYFRIIAHGDGFDVDHYLSHATLSPTRVWRKETRSHFEEVASTSGFEVFLGDGDLLYVHEQEKTAIAYLKTHFDDLQACGTSSGMQFFSLMLHQRVEVREDLCGFSVEVSPQLFQLAMELRIHTSTFVELVREDRFY